MLHLDLRLQGASAVEITELTGVQQVKRAAGQLRKAPCEGWTLSFREEWKCINKNQSAANEPSL